MKNLIPLIAFGAMMLPVLSGPVDVNTEVLANVAFNPEMSGGEAGRDGTVAPFKGCARLDGQFARLLMAGCIGISRTCRRW